MKIKLFIFLLISVLSLSACGAGSRGGGGGTAGNNEDALTLSATVQAPSANLSAGLVKGLVKAQVSDDDTAASGVTCTFYAGSTILGTCTTDDSGACSSSITEAAFLAVAETDGTNSCATGLFLSCDNGIMLYPGDICHDSAGDGRELPCGTADYQTTSAWLSILERMGFSGSNFEDLDFDTYLSGRNLHCEYLIEHSRTEYALENSTAGGLTDDQYVCGRNGKGSFCFRS